MLKILVMANYKYIPSLDDIVETSAVTRLRNQLLEAEHYQLAVEVSQSVLYNFPFSCQAIQKYASQSEGLCSVC